MGGPNRTRPSALPLTAFNLLDLWRGARPTLYLMRAGDPRSILKAPIEFSALREADSHLGGPCVLT